MSDPATLDEYNAKYVRNQSITGYGARVVTHFPCPGCAEPGWLDFPVTAALDGYAALRDARSCVACGRSFRMVITVEDGGAAEGGSTAATIVQTAGPDIADYLPRITREES